MKQLKITRLSVLYFTNWRINGIKLKNNDPVMFFECNQENNGYE